MGHDAHISLNQHSLPLHMIITKYLCTAEAEKRRVLFFLKKQRPWHRKAIIEEEGRIAGLRSTRFPLVETRRCFANLVQRAGTISNESGNYKTAVESHRHRETHVALVPPPEPPSCPPMPTWERTRDTHAREHARTHARGRSRVCECVSSRGLRASRFCII